MIGLKGIASFVPDQALDNFEQAAHFGESADFIEGKIGAARLPRMDADAETSDLVANAVEALLAKHPNLDRNAIDALVVVTQNGDGQGLPHTAAIAQHKLGLKPSVAAFDVSLGCSGYVYGLYVLKGFMEATGLQNGILVTADPYSKIINPEDRVTALLFGDAATATWLGYGADWTLGKAFFGTDGSGAEHLQIKDARLQMNGRQIFNFASLKVAPHIKNLLASAGFNESDIDAYCIHQGSKAIVDCISRRFDQVSDRFLLDMKDVGNTVSSSIPLLLEKRLFTEDWKRIVISGFGVGLSLASGILINQKGI